MAPLFDRIVVVDWSARTGPARGADSIWICSLDPGHPGSGAPALEVVENVPTRLEAHERLRALLTGPRRVLLAIDVALGYPAGTAAAAGLVERGASRPAWRAMWEHLARAYREGPRNRPPRDHDRWTVATDLNRRFVESGVGPHFWGCPPRRASDDLTTTRPAAVALGPDRECETRLRARGLRPFSVWQLLGAGAVGSQTLTAIPMLEALRHELGGAGRTVVWPYETGLDEQPVVAALRRATVVIAEIWPGTLAAHEIEACVPPVGADVKDSRQVTALARHLAGLDASGDLVDRFAPRLAPDTAARVVDEEGWVLAMPFDTVPADARLRDDAAAVVREPRAPRRTRR